MAIGRDDRPKVMLLAAALLATVLGLGSLAWACEAQAYIQIDTTSGPPGTKITVKGAAFPDASVAISFGSGSPSSPNLGQAQGPTFTVAVEVPNVSPGIYYVVASTEDGEFQVRAAAAFRVLAPEPSPSPTPSASANAGRSEAAPAPTSSSGDTSAPPAVMQPSTTATEALALPTAGSGQQSVQSTPARRSSAVTTPPPDRPAPTDPVVVPAPATPVHSVRFAAVLADPLPVMPTLALTGGAEAETAGGRGSGLAARMLGSYSPAALVAATLVAGGLPIAFWRRKRRGPR